MKNKYTRLFCLLVLSLFGLFISQTLFAQTAPVIQWQKLLYGPAKQASNGDLLIASGNVIRLASDGTQKWATSLATYSAIDLTILPNGNSVILARDGNYYYKWALIQLDAAGTILWTKPFADYTNPNGGYPQRTPITVIKGTDEGFVVIGSISYGRNGSGTELYKFDNTGSLTKQPGVSYANEFPPSSVANQIIPTRDGGYLIVGSTRSAPIPDDRGIGLTSSRGWAAKLNANMDQVWTDRYDFAGGFSDVIASPFNSDAFIAAGSSTDGKATVTLVISPTNPPLNNTGGTSRPKLSYTTLTNFPYEGTITNISSSIRIVSSNATSFEVIDGVDQRAGDIRIASFGEANQTRWTKIVGGTAADIVNSAITTQDGGYVLAGLTQSSDGDVQGKPNSSVSGWLVKLAPGTPLTLTQPTYNCSTGAITFNTTGGDDSPITFSAPGITRSSATSNTGTVEQGLRNDPKTILITATQSGQTTTYSFDLKAFCSGTTPTPTPPVTPVPPTTGGTLTLTQPTYDCSTGAITFNSTGGNGSTITYSAPGITRSSATSNTGTVEQGLRNDPKTILITAMQSGQMATYSFDFKSFCSGNPPTPASTLKLLTPIIDCSLRQVTLVTSGGDGSAITFDTPTITRSSATSPIGIVDFCVGAQPPVLRATQSGYTATYEGFDFVKLCPAYLGVKPLIATKIPDINVPLGQYTSITLQNYFINPSQPVNRYVPTYSFTHLGSPAGSSLDDQSSTFHNFTPYAFLYLNTTASGVYSITVTGKNECGPAATSTFTLVVNPASGTSPLMLVAPTYNCSTGAITFNYTGGNGSAVEFQAAGITGWTTNPNQFVDKDSRTANDVKPFTLMARQNGQVVTYTWDLKAACGRSARVAAAEARQGLQLTVKGNPVGNTALVAISGVDGQAVQLDLLNASGHVLEQRHIEQAGVVEEQRFDLQRQPSGMLLLRAQSGQQRQTVKLIKQ